MTGRKDSPRIGAGVSGGAAERRAAHERLSQIRSFEAVSKAVIRR
jgi:hypothetical protein